MTDNASPVDYPPRKALQEIENLSRFDHALRQRTEGVTWALWGFVVAGIFTSYGFAGAHFDATWPWWGSVLWVPWGAAGVLVTGALWQSVALTRPEAAESDVPEWLHPVTWIGLIVGTLAAVFALQSVLAASTLSLLVVSAVALVLGAVNPLRYTRAGRRMLVAVGVLGLAAGAVTGALGVGDALAAVVGGVVGGGGFLVGGLVVSLRG